MWVIILVGVLAFFLYLLTLKSHKYWENKGIPYVRPLPFVGNLGPNLLRKKSFAQLSQEWYSMYPDKKCVGFYQFLSPVLLIRDPELIKQIAVKEFETFPGRKPFVSEDVDPLWDKNLIALKGDKWHDMRATLSPSFTGNKMKIMFGLMKACATQLSTYLLKKGDIVVIQTKEVFSRFSTDVFATAAFGVDCNSLENRKNEFYLMSKDVASVSSVISLRFMIQIISPTLMKFFKVGIFSNAARKFFRKLITQTIKTREEKNIIRPDMIHLLMEARNRRLKYEDSEVIDSGFAAVQESDLGKTGKIQKAVITDDDITAHCLFFFLAGFDSVATLMSFAVYELALNPDVQKKLQKEVDATLEACSGELTYEALLGMKYLDMVTSETLRKWPGPSAIARMSAKPFVIQPQLPEEKPIVLDVGTNVWFPMYAIHRDPKYYPNPEKFDPERFSDENVHNIKPYTYLPFGAGPRNCIGARFALLEGKLGIAEIVSKFEVVPVEKTQIPLRLDTSTFTVQAHQGLWLGLKPRINSL